MGADPSLRGCERLEPQLPDLSRPPSGRGVRKHGQALIAGPRIVAEVRERFPERVMAWITDDSQSPPTEATVEWYRLASRCSRSSTSRGQFAPASSQPSTTTCLVGRSTLAGRLHPVHPLPGPREHRRRDPLGRGLRRCSGRPPQGVGTSHSIPKVAARQAPHCFRLLCRRDRRFTCSPHARSR